MTLPRGRVIKADGIRKGAAEPLAKVKARASRVVKSVAFDAAARAKEIIATAEERARALVAAAEGEARRVREGAREEGRREGALELATAMVQLRALEAKTDERDLDRTVELAKAMAERLLGEALRLDPGRIAAIARQVLASARRARRVTLKAHPDDAAALQSGLPSLDIDPGLLEVQVDPGQSRGSLLLHTDLGILDADLTLQLDRLARSLRDSFRSG